jgi:hypothetical protein
VQGSSSSPRPAFPRCELKSLAWAQLFGIPARAVASPEGRRDLCRAISKAVPITARRGYHVHRLLNRGAYGVVFAAHNPAAAVPWAALKVQFVCPREVVRTEDRKRCAAFGQRASPYNVVRYEAMQHKRVHETLQALADNPAVSARLPLPSVPIPLGAQRMVVGRKGQFKGVPPDGRRRLWVSLMEFMEGRSVRQTMQDARRRGTLTLEAFRGVCEGVLRHMRVLHTVGFTHGDLHTGNVLVDEARAAENRPWVILVDLERSIPRAFFEEAPLAALGMDTTQAEAFWEAARLWDLKLFVESCVRLAESVGAYSPSLERPAAGSLSSRHSSASETPPRQRFRRALDLGRAMVLAYLGGNAAAAARYEAVLPTWVARSLWLKRDAAAGIPDEVAEEIAGSGSAAAREAVVRDILARDRLEHRSFFQLLRAVQGFYTTSARRHAAQARRRRPEGLDPAAILPSPPGQGRLLRSRTARAARSPSLRSDFHQSPSLRSDFHHAAGQ